MKSGGTAGVTIATTEPLPSRRVVLVTAHAWKSRHRADSHLLARAYQRAGWDVVFMTVALGRFSMRRGDDTTRGLRRVEANHLFKDKSGVWSYLWFTWWHPVNLRMKILNRIARPLFSRYGRLRLGRVEELIRDADLVIFESSPGLLLFDRLRTLNPNARFVYRVSDDLRVLWSHSAIIDAERKAVDEVDLVSVPCARLVPVVRGSAPVEVHGHGIEKQLFERATASPYENGRPRIVFVGISDRFDFDFLTRAARLRPDVDFHLIGPLAREVEGPNIHYYGVLPIEGVIPFMQHADAVLHSPRPEARVDAFADSLEVHQYTYCRLPIVAPSFFAPAHPNFCLYEPGDDATINAALEAALTADRSTIDTSAISSYDEIAAKIAGPCWHSRPVTRRRRVVFISPHYFASKRRAGMHMLASAFERMGDDIVFTTAPISLLSWLRRDPRFQYPVWEEARDPRPVTDRLTSYVLFTTIHPANLRARVLNRIATPLYRRYADADLGPLRIWLEGADIVIFETGAGILLLDQVRDAAPDARLVYRVSDDMRTLRLPSVVTQEEEHVAPVFSMISTPSWSIYERFANLPTAALHPHAVVKEAFDRVSESPYADGRNAVFVGVALLDLPVIEALACSLPDWRLHIIGPFKDLPELPNVHGYGEMSFAETVPYVKHADIGLATLSRVPYGEAFTDSLKIVQYTYCRLPIVAPDFLRREGREHVFHYESCNPETAVAALRAASTFDRSRISSDGILDWSDLATLLAGDEP